MDKELADGLLGGGASALPGFESYASRGSVQVEALEASPAVFPTFEPAAPAAAPTGDIERVLDIPVQLSVELGRTRMPIRRLLQLAEGSVIELDGVCGEPLDVLVNGCLIAKGEVVVVNDRFGIRLTEVVTAAERMRNLSR